MVWSTMQILNTFSTTFVPITFTVCRLYPFNLIYCFKSYFNSAFHYLFCFLHFPFLFYFATAFLSLKISINRNIFDFPIELFNDNKFVDNLNLRILDPKSLLRRELQVRFEAAVILADTGRMKARRRDTREMSTF